MPDHDDLDHLVDSALATYAAPAPGFEERLVRSIASAERAEPVLRRRWVPWGIALAAAACLLMAVTVFLHIRQPQASGIEQAHSAPFTPVLVKPNNRKPRPVAVSRTRTKHSTRGRALTAAVATPKLDVFPTPQPLTAEERVLAAAATSGDEADRQRLLTASNPPPDTPLAIAGLSIPPLAPIDEAKK